MQYRFTKSAGAAVSAAADAAQDNGQRYIGTEHLLLGLLRASDGLAARVLIKNKVDEAKLVELIDKLVGKHEVLEDGEAGGFLNCRREKLHVLIQTGSAQSICLLRF